MDLSFVTFLLFAAFSGLRIFSYLPQIYRVATDRNGASAIAYSTWFMWVGANAATGLYAAVNLKDLYLAAVSVVFAICCVVVILLTFFKRRRIHIRTAAPSISRVRPIKMGPAKRGAQMVGMVIGSVAALAITAGAGWMRLERAAAEISTSKFATSTATLNTANDSADEFVNPKTADKRDERGLQFSVGHTLIAVTQDRLSARGAYNFDIRR